MVDTDLRHDCVGRNCRVHDRAGVESRALLRGIFLTECRSGLSPIVYLVKAAAGSGLLSVLGEEQGKIYCLMRDPRAIVSESGNIRKER